VDISRDRYKGYQYGDSAVNAIDVPVGLGGKSWKYSGV